jgi:hypothetical protein
LEQSHSASSQAIKISSNFHNPFFYNLKLTVADTNVLVVVQAGASVVNVLPATVGTKLVAVQSPVPQLPQELPSPQPGPLQPGPSFVDHVDHVDPVDHEDQVPTTNSVQLLAAFSQLVGT